MRRSWKALTITATVLLVSFGAMTLASATMTTRPCCTWTTREFRPLNWILVPRAPAKATR